MGVRWDNFTSPISSSFISLSTTVSVAASFEITHRAVYVFLFASSPSLRAFIESLYFSNILKWKQLHIQALIYWVRPDLTLKIMFYWRCTYFVTSCRSLTKISLVKRLISHCIVSNSVEVRLTFLEFTNSNRNGRPLPSIRTSTSSRPEELNLATVWIDYQLLANITRAQ